MGKLQNAYTHAWFFILRYNFKTNDLRKLLCIYAVYGIQYRVFFPKLQFACLFTNFTSHRFSHKTHLQNSSKLT